MPGFSRSGPQRPQREKHFFIVSGLPEHFSWQKLKDAVREFTDNQPGWTNMEDSWNDPNGAKGYFSVKSDLDAAKAYSLLLSVMTARIRRPLLVHHFDASRHVPFLLRCNCPSYFPGVSEHSDRSCITARSVSSALRNPNWQPMAPAPYVTIPMQHPGMTVPMHVQQMPMYAPPVTYYQQMPAMTVHMPVSPVMTNEYGLPVNPTNGVVRTESRGVHLSSLPRPVTENQVRELLQPFGQILGVEMRKDWATARLDSIEGVRQAVETLDKRKWRGRQIVVKEDRDSTSIPSPGLLIANGKSRGSNRAANW